MTSSGVVRSASSVECMAPHQSPRIVTVSISFSASGSPAENIPGALTFQYVGPMHIVQLFPTLAPTSGGVVVSVAGSGLLPDSVCRFSSIDDHVEAPSIFLTSSALQCTSPAMGSGLWTLAVVAALGAIESNGIHFLTHIDLSVMAVKPSRGSLSGMTPVTVFGSGFNQFTSVFCKFGRSPPLSCVVLSASIVECTSPSTVTAGKQAVEVSADGHHFTSDGVAFEFRIENQIITVHPTSGSLRGGTQ
eukprot:1389496-Rhodomonas_salina.1